MNGIQSGEMTTEPIEQIEVETRFDEVFERQIEEYNDISPIVYTSIRGVDASGTEHEVCLDANSLTHFNVLFDLLLEIGPNETDHINMYSGTVIGFHRHGDELDIRHEYMQEAIYDPSERYGDTFRVTANFDAFARAAISGAEELRERIIETARETDDTTFRPFEKQTVDRFGPFSLKKFRSFEKRIVDARRRFLEDPDVPPEVDVDRLVSDLERFRHTLTERGGTVPDGDVGAVLELPESLGPGDVVAQFHFEDIVWDPTRFPGARYRPAPDVLVVLFDDYIVVPAADSETTCFDAMDVTLRRLEEEDLLEVDFDVTDRTDIRHT